MQRISIRTEAEQEAALDEAVRTVLAGGTLVFPTDTLYGLGCNGLEPGALGRVFDIKRRSYTQALPLLVRDVRWARELAHVDERRERLLAELWPGRVTFILTRKDIVPSAAAGGGTTIALRAPDHPFAQELLRRAGYPLCGTSANVSGQPSSQNPDVIMQGFAPFTFKPDLVLDAGILPPSEPSTVVDLSGPTPRITRQGAVRADRILPLL
ncbi:MAG TPA: L-threonylcarbamoyladenylate synthase [Candidatus Paceibacterota bacterium]|nr:L-threonylcarbamoyladenylate synthase [Candidatus Paceibacterota bacterium]